jgi:hypothetical protein
MIPFEKSSLLLIDNDEDQKIVALVTQSITQAVVVHLDVPALSELSVGDIVDLNDTQFLPFVGTVHLDSQQVTAEDAK